MKGGKITLACRPECRIVGDYIVVVVVVDVFSGR